MSKQLVSVLGFCGVLLAHGAYAQTIPPPWQWTDVGAVGTGGDVHVGANNDWFVSGRGAQHLGNGG